MYLPFYRHQLRDKATGSASELVTAFLWLKTLPKFYFAVYCAHPLRIALVLGHLSAYALLARGVLAGFRSYRKLHSRVLHKVRMAVSTTLMISTNWTVCKISKYHDEQWTPFAKIFPIYWYLYPSISRMFAGILYTMFLYHLMAPKVSRMSDTLIFTMRIKPSVKIPTMRIKPSFKSILKALAPG